MTPVRADVLIGAPRLVAFRAYRDRLRELLPFLPDVRSLKVTKETVYRLGRIERSQVWVGGGDIPAGLRMFVTPLALTWTDHAVWREGDIACAWEVFTHEMPGAVHVTGSHRFVEDVRGRTLLQTRGYLEVNASKVPGVPGLVAAPVGALAETFLQARISAQTKRAGEALARLLSSG